MRLHATPIEQSLQDSFFRGAGRLSVKHLSRDHRRFFFPFKHPNYAMKKINPDLFVSSLKEAFEEPPENLGPSTVLRDLDGWDSLTSVMIVAEIYADYGVQISGDEMRDCRTVFDLISLVETKLSTAV